MTTSATEGPVTKGGQERRIIVMIGAPGAGKGTQAERLSGRLGLPHVSTGKLFRSAVRNENEIGAQVRAYVEAGSLVPDEVAVKVVDDRLHEVDAGAGAILDGFPRTRNQAVALDEMLARADDRVCAALYVEVATEDLVARLTGRRVCTIDDQHVYHIVTVPPRQDGICDIEGAPLRQREDDQPETLRKRLERQLAPMYEVIDHYADSGVLFPVRGDQPADKVTEALLQALAASERIG